ncbi:gliding motility lipoprotein GldB [Mucilaginibacter sp.]|uniref:gliding motility lipoprotein GldB n=1 Tax=Mucilaginibacter sp. TaxID=1882438 RepID=UPI00283FD763|nr:gliding motility lipoprotein GldB [Mucilaginibacter sp.]MDR3693263.1 gliding motility lipoprotein GldB [Mucilaginibacter sp.]
MILFNKTKQIYLFFLTGVLLSACVHKKVDVSNIPVNVKIERFDKEFDAMKTRPMAQQAVYLQKKYGPFYHDFIATLLQDNQINTTDTAYFALLRKIFVTKDYNDLKHDIDSVYPNLDKPEAELTDAFRHIKYYYPDKKLPAVYAFVSGFETPIITDNGLYGIGLDLFLGANSRFYPALTSAWPRYMSRNFNEQNICPRLTEAITREDMFPESDSSKTLMSKMIYNGKIMYFMDQVLPDAADTLKIGYTDAQLKWCQQFESKIWAWFIDQNLLYESDYQKIQKYISVAPFTPGLGEKNESAPKLAIWTGWQIVRRYMEKHPDVTLQQLMADNDAQKILTESDYHPK